MDIVISNEIKMITPKFNVGVMIADVTIQDDIRIDSLIQEIEEKIANEIDINEVVNLPIIKDGRDAYKKYGKDPSRYRLATESLYRRLSKGNKLYRINNVVDIGNLLSITTRKSVAVLDYNRIEGNVEIRLGKDSDEYNGIGRGKINIKNIPVYSDDLSAFGSCTSDTERTMITSATSRILLFIISFSGKAGLESEISDAKDLYKKYANASNITTFLL